MRKFHLLAAVAASALLATEALASPVNEPPPAGAFLNLAVPNSDGSGNTTTVPHSYQQYTADFTANVPETNLTFAFREDPAFLSLSNVSLINLTTSSANLLLNGNFALGTIGASAPTDWTYLNQYGAEAGGVLQSSCGHGGGNCYYDGAVQAYDAITQVVATTPGDTYQVSFWLTDNGSLTNFSALSTNGNTTGTGGNGIDLLVYAGVGAPPPGNIPEPASLTLLAAALAGFGALRRRNGTKRE
jgi:hypothetical protein